MDNNIYAISYKMRVELYHRILLIISVVLACFVAVSLFVNFVVSPVKNKSNSMAPDIPAGSSEFVIPFLRTPDRGDVVLIQTHEPQKKSLPKKVINALFMFITAQHWYPFEESPRTGVNPVIRRVVGMPGDTIYLDRYVVYIKPRNQEHFLSEFEFPGAKYNVSISAPPAGWDTELGAKANTDKIVLGENEYYVLGDNRMESSDSRLWGVVNQSSIRGKVVMLYFPFSKIKMF